MASNRFGQQFCCTTWGESHGPAMGVVIDGCPAGVKISEAMIQQALDLRRPGQSDLVSGRSEPDQCQILSGVFEGKTLGSPISILIHNKDVRSADYDPLKNVLRPGHANFTYLHKYGCFDHRGGGRASARETVCRVAAGAVASQLLASQGIYTTSYLAEVGEVRMPPIDQSAQVIQQQVEKDPCWSGG